MKQLIFKDDAILKVCNLYTVKEITKLIWKQSFATLYKNSNPYAFVRVLSKVHFQSIFTCPRSEIETPEQSVKYVYS